MSGVALRMLVQAEPDADPIEFALAAAGGLGGPIFVVNGTGKDLGGYRMRHEFEELVDDAGRPSRSVSEVLESIERVQQGSGCLVVLDVSRIYRASRCALRQGESVKELSPGHWDLVNESLGQLGEATARMGIPSVWTAPSTPTHGLDDDGRDVIVGSAPQVWRDLTRQAHVWVALERRGMRVEAELRGDDFRALGRLGEVLADVDGRDVGRKLARFVDRRGRASTTTMSEAAVAELAARARLEAQREAQADKLMQRYQELAPVRALRGREAWSQLRASWERDRLRLDAERAQRIDQVLASWARAAESGWYSIRAYERTLEQGPGDPEEALGLRLAGPAPEALKVDAPEVAFEELDELAVEDVPNWVDRVSVERLEGWIRAVGEALDVWSRPRLAAIAGTLLHRHPPRQPRAMPSLGHDWSAYPDEQLRDLLAALVRMVVVERREGPGLGHGSSTWRAASGGGEDSGMAATASTSEVTATSQVVDREPTCAAATYLDLVTDDEGSADRDELPSAEGFAELDDRDQSVILSALLTLRRLWSDLAKVCERAGVEPGTRVVGRWSTADRVTVYASLGSGRTGLSPPLSAVS